MSRESEPVTIAEGGTAEGLVLVITRLVAIEGRVVDAATKGPIPGAVVADWDPEWPSFPTGRARVTADAAGRFRLDGMQRGSMVLHAVAEGHLKVKVDVAVSGEADAQVTVEMPPARSLEVLAVDEEGRPLEGATIHFETVQSSFNPPRTDARGIAAVPVPADGLGSIGKESRTLTVSLTGRVTAEVPVKDEDLAAGRIRAVLARAGSIAGRVVDHEGRPVGDRLTADDLDEVVYARRWSFKRHSEQPIPPI